MIEKALQSIRPNTKWVLTDSSYASLDWLDESQTKPTEVELLAEVTRLQTEYDAKEYQRKRQAEYPPITDYLDGIVKGDQEQISAYISKCLVVKNKYPKGMV